MAPSANMGSHSSFADKLSPFDDEVEPVRRPRVRDFIRAFGGVADDPLAAQHNTAALNHSLRSLSRGDTLHIPAHTFHITGGLEGDGLVDVTIRIDGSLVFSPDPSTWPPQHGQTPQASLSAVSACNPGLLGPRSEVEPRSH